MDTSRNGMSEGSTSDWVTTKVEKGIPSGMPFALCGDPVATYEGSLLSVFN